MTVILAKDGLLGRFAQGAADIEACQRLRYRSFFGEDGIDTDPFDAKSKHLMIEKDGALVCTMRLRVFENGADLTKSYTGGYYDLSKLSGPSIEVGRFCLREKGSQADVLRLALSELTRLVDKTGAAFLFGCTSFEGNDPAKYADAFAYLAAHHQGPAALVPQPLDAGHFALEAGSYNLTNSLKQMPKLLRSYLSMNGWVGDAVVVDPLLKTMHVFTRLDVTAVPEARANALRGA